MAQTSRKQIARRVLDRYGRTFSDELNIDIARNAPSPLFRLLCYSILSSAPIGHGLALRAARALADAGWTTARAMTESTWRQRVRVLDRSGYARYDERTATMLADTADYLVAEYDGDLRKLRARAERDPERERELLKEFKGIGDVGAGIFLREVQVAWDELYPFADDRVLDAARRLKLGGSAREIERLAGSRRDYVRLVAGLMRVRLQKDFAEVREAA